MNGASVSLRLAWRFLVPHTGNWFAALNALISIGGIALGIAVLNTVWAVMLGFQEDLKGRMLATHAHLDISQAEPLENYQPWVDALLKTKGVRGAEAYVQREMMIATHRYYARAIVKGVQPERFPEVSHLVDESMVTPRARELFAHPEQLEALTASRSAFESLPPLRRPPTSAGIDDDDLPDFADLAKRTRPQPGGIFLGRELAKDLGLVVDNDDDFAATLGVEVMLISPLGDLGPNGLMPVSRRFRVAGVFHSGMFEYDSCNVYIGLNEAQALLNMPGQVDAVEAALLDPNQAPSLAESLKKQWPKDMRITTWHQRNKNLISALKLEQWALGLALLLITVVAAFNIIMTLSMIVLEKRPQIAMLCAMGMPRNQLRRVFLNIGMITGAIGVTLGIGTALSICTYLKWAKVSIYTNVFYFDAVPVVIQGERFALVGGVALLICLASSLYPAERASRLFPVEGLRV